MKLDTKTCEYTNEPEVSRWIPVSERLPEPHTDVLVARYDRLKSVTSSFRVAGDGPDKWYHDNVTHWQPLPPAPVDDAPGTATISDVTFRKITEQTDGHCIVGEPMTPEETGTALADLESKGLLTRVPDALRTASERIDTCKEIAKRWHETTKSEGETLESLRRERDDFQYTAKYWCDEHAKVKKLFDDRLADNARLAKERDNWHKSYELVCQQRDEIHREQNTDLTATVARLRGALEPLAKWIDDYEMLGGQTLANTEWVAEQSRAAKAALAETCCNQT